MIQRRTEFGDVDGSSVTSGGGGICYGRTNKGGVELEFGSEGNVGVYDE